MSMKLTVTTRIHTQEVVQMTREHIIEWHREKLKRWSFKKKSDLHFIRHTVEMLYEYFGDATLGNPGRRFAKHLNMELCVDFISMCGAIVQAHSMDDLMAQCFGPVTL